MECIPFSLDFPAAVYLPAPCSDVHGPGHRPGYRRVTIPTPFGPDTLWVKLPDAKPRPHHVTPAVKTPRRVGQLTEPLMQDEAGAGTAGCSSRHCC